MADTPKVYLGDGVYGCVDDCLGVVLTTENGISVTNRIVLEPEVLRNFQEWVRSLAKALERR